MKNCHYFKVSEVSQHPQNLSFRRYFCMFSKEGFLVLYYIEKNIFGSKLHALF